MPVDTAGKDNPANPSEKQNTADNGEPASNKHTEDQNAADKVDPTSNEPATEQIASASGEPLEEENTQICVYDRLETLEAGSNDFLQPFLLLEEEPVSEFKDSSFYCFKPMDCGYTVFPDTATYDEGDVFNSQSFLQAFNPVLEASSFSQDPNGQSFVFDTSEASFSSADSMVTNVQTMNWLNAFSNPKLSITHESEKLFVGNLTVEQQQRLFSQSVGAHASEQQRLVPQPAGAHTFEQQPRLAPQSVDAYAFEQQRLVLQPIGAHAFEQQMIVPQPVGAHAYEQQIIVPQPVDAHTFEQQQLVPQPFGAYAFEQQRIIPQPVNAHTFEQQQRLILQPVDAYTFDQQQTLVPQPTGAHVFKQQRVVPQPVEAHAFEQQQRLVPQPVGAHAFQQHLVPQPVDVHIFEQHQKFAPPFIGANAVPQHQRLFPPPVSVYAIGHHKFVPSPGVDAIEIGHGSDQPSSVHASTSNILEQIIVPQPTSHQPLGGSFPTDQQQTLFSQPFVAPTMEQPQWFITPRFDAHATQQRLDSSSSLSQFSLDELENKPRSSKFLDFFCSTEHTHSPTTPTDELEQRFETFCDLKNSPGFQNVTTRPIELGNQPPNSGASSTPMSYYSSGLTTSMSRVSGYGISQELEKQTEMNVSCQYQQEPVQLKARPPRPTAFELQLERNEQSKPPQGLPHKTELSKPDPKGYPDESNQQWRQVKKYKILQRPKQPEKEPPIPISAHSRSKGYEHEKQTEMQQAVGQSRPTSLKLQSRSDGQQLPQGFSHQEAEPPKTRPKGSPGKSYKQGRQAEKHPMHTLSGEGPSFPILTEPQSKDYEQEKQRELSISHQRQQELMRQEAELSRFVSELCGERYEQQSEHLQGLYEEQPSKGDQKSPGKSYKQWRQTEKHQIHQTHQEEGPAIAIPAEPQSEGYEKQLEANILHQDQQGLTQQDGSAWGPLPVEPRGENDEKQSAVEIDTWDSFCLQELLHQETEPSKFGPIGRTSKKQSMQEEKPQLQSHTHQDKEPLMALPATPYTTGNEQQKEAKARLQHLQGLTLQETGLGNMVPIEFLRNIYEQQTGAYNIYQYCLDSLQQKSRPSRPCLVELNNNYKQSQTGLNGFHQKRQGLANQEVGPSVFVPVEPNGKNYEQQWQSATYTIYHILQGLMPAHLLPIYPHSILHSYRSTYLNNLRRGGQQDRATFPLPAVFELLYLRFYNDVATLLCTKLGNPDPARNSRFSLLSSHASASQGDALNTSDLDGRRPKRVKKCPPKNEQTKLSGSEDEKDTKQDNP